MLNTEHCESSKRKNPLSGFQIVKSGKISLPFIVLSVLAIFSLLLSFQNIINVKDESQYLNSDAREYLSIANNLDAGLGYRLSVPSFNGKTETSFRTPGYPYFILLVKKIIGGEQSIRLVIILQHLLLAFLPLLFYLLANYCFSLRSCALLAAAASFLFYPFRFLADIIHPDFLGLFCLLLAIVFFFSHQAAPHLLKLLAFSLFIVVSILIKQNLIFLMALFVYPMPRLLKRKEWVLAIILPVIILSGWVFRNYQVHHQFPVFTTNGGLNFYIANHPLIKTDLSNVISYAMVMKELMDSGLSEVEADRQLYKSGWKNMIENGWAWQIKKIFEKFKVTFRNFYPPVKNTAFYLLLPFILALPRKKIPLFCLIFFQWAVFLAYNHASFSMSTIYEAFALDVPALNVMGLSTLVYLLVRKNSHIRFLFFVYALILILPLLIYFSLDRLTAMSAFLLIIAFAFSPSMIRSLFVHGLENLNSGRINDTEKA